VPAPYAQARAWSYLSALAGVPLPRISTHSCLDAPVSVGTHPVVFLEHGFTGTFTDYTFLAEDLASRGYVVVAVDHTGEATVVEFANGRLETSVFGSYLTRYTRNDAGGLGFAVAVRLDDLRFTMATLERLNASPASEFAGRLDLSRAALAGHSLGGLATLRGLDSSQRFKVGVLLDGVLPPNPPTPIRQPVLHVVAGREFPRRELARRSTGIAARRSDGGSGYRRDRRRGLAVGEIAPSGWLNVAAEPASDRCKMVPHVRIAMGGRKRMRAMIQTARLRIAYGELPRRHPEMTLRGISQGSACSLCRLPIEPETAEVQFPDPRSGKVYALHPECHTAWSIALRKMTAGADEDAVDRGEAAPAHS
jgi:dienelactone hydrolase